MSVRMALAKLCACTCGGALIGGGAVQVATPTSQVQTVKHKKVKARKIARGEPVRKVKRMRKMVTRTTHSCTPTVVTVTTTPGPVPMPPPPVLYG